MKKFSRQVKALILGLVSMGVAGPSAAPHQKQDVSRGFMGEVSRQVPVQSFKVARPSDTTGWATSVAPQPPNDANKKLMRQFKERLNIHEHKVARPSDTTGWKTSASDERAKETARIENELMKMVKDRLTVEAQEVAKPSIDTTGWKTS